MYHSTHNNDNNKSKEEQEEIMATVSAMRQQEEVYRSDFYLKNIEVAYGEKYYNENKSSNEKHSWRCKMVEWCFAICDYFELNDSYDSVATAMNILDRFMSIITERKNIIILYDDNNNDRTKDEGEIITNTIEVRELYYQFTAMVCFYIAAKIQGPMMIEPKTFSLTSMGAYSEEQIIDMERTIVTSLQWRLNPPTPMSFIHCFLNMFPNEIIDTSTMDNDNDNECNMILELTIKQIKLGIKDNLFIGSYASHLAVAALTNSIHAIKSTSCNGNNYYHDEIIQKTISNITIQNGFCSEDIALYQDYLWTFLVKEEYLLPKIQRNNNNDKSILSTLKPDKIMTNITAVSNKNDKLFISGSPRNIFLEKLLK
mmetsp:Transcript_932/g.1149  ORF Transcript_932/g.1149 Transcript_932/m.1149 type:complete len:370 (+) Transcript_932:140-1249(+)